MVVAHFPSPDCFRVIRRKIYGYTFDGSRSMSLIVEVSFAGEKLFESDFRIMEDCEGELFIFDKNFVSGREYYAGGVRIKVENYKQTRLSESEYRIRKLNLLLED